MTSEYERGQSVLVRPGPWEAPCPACRAPVGDTAWQAGAGIVFSGPIRPLWRCTCGHRWIGDDGWYHVDLGPVSVLRPYTALEPADA